MSKDKAHFLDMLIAARKVERFAADLPLETFYESELHQSAILRELQVIGEAARKVSDEGKAAHPEIPWTDIAPLIAQLEPLVPPEEGA